MRVEELLEKPGPIWFVYLIQTERGNLYTGITTNVTRRLAQHRSGRGAKALKGRGQLTLVYHTAVADHSTALTLEYRIKRLRRQQKLQLVAKQPNDLRSWLLC